MVYSMKGFQASIFCVSALSTGQYVRGDLKQSSMHLLQSLKVKCCAFARLCILIFLNLYNLLSKANENKRHAKQVLHMSPLILDDELQSPAVYLSIVVYCFSLLQSACPSINVPLCLIYLFFLKGTTRNLHIVRNSEVFKVINSLIIYPDDVHDYDCFDYDYFSKHGQNGSFQIPHPIKKSKALCSA